ncbi:U-box domain-containing 38-like [Olea europaea subsp. europaea]|uniref:RING-type E3 ubiquitin transferase n=1 Tax=Olea europaea subsp. europaea TaxID=158383 RepID=A0A8S0T0X5_OLEEU|nr:U-box domain-containing 38-like [Olea europaea subsp. europaea]
MGGNGKKLHKWKITFHRPFFKSDGNKKLPPQEFICPISNSLMSDPVVVSSGQTFERLSIKVCKDLDVTPTLPDGSNPDFTNIIPNLALKSTIQNWCSKSGFEHPNPPEYSEVESIISSSMGFCLMSRDNSKIGVSESDFLNGVSETTPVLFSHAASELNCPNFYSCSSSDESVIANTTPRLPFATRPSCFSASSSPTTSTEFIVSDEVSSYNSATSEDENLVNMMKTSDVFEQEQAVILLRKITRTNEEARVSLCTERLLFALKELLNTRYAALQSNAAAALVNLSLAKVNKIKIVRAGIIPLLIDILKNGFQESQDHATGAIFSLALEDENRTAIGVLGALPPLLHALRSGWGTTRLDAAMALYHLTLVQSNRAKIIKLGAVGTLLGLLKDPAVAAQVLLVVVNLAACAEGRSALLDANAVECLVGMLRKWSSSGSGSTRENCVVALYSLSHGSLRFNGLARDARVADVLREVVESGSDRAREKARRILVMLRERDEEEEGREDEEVDWEAVMEGGVTRARRLNWEKS